MGGSEKYKKNNKAKRMKNKNLKKVAYGDCE